MTNNDEEGEIIREPEQNIPSDGWEGGEIGNPKEPLPLAPTPLG